MLLDIQYEIARQRGEELRRRAEAERLIRAARPQRRTRIRVRETIADLLVAAAERIRPQRRVGDTCLGTAHDRLALRG